ncbi:MAG: FAD-dependent oxidoreductase [Verrucomicrobia bacterium]|nr:FAD-dependent oxidoreductase [Verrucomicrobiota bacterium]
MEERENMETYVERARELPVAGSYDVVVCGGGPAGFMAALASARRGARTLLVERYGILGGTATAGMMVEFGSIYDGAQTIVGGATHEFLHRLVDFGGVERFDARAHSMIFDPESMIAICLDMCKEAGVEMLFHTLVVDAVKSGTNVNGVILENKSGRSVVRGKVLIDATGDGDVAARAGAAFRTGRDGDSMVQPVTLEVILGNVDVTRLPKSHHDVTAAIREAASRGEWAIPTERIFSWGRVCKRGAPDDPHAADFFINVTNALNVDGTSARDLTRAEIETRGQLEGLLRFLREHVTGFEKCFLDRTAVQVGIRETRRITGDYELTREDVLSARHFPDGVVPACNSIDVHEVTGKNFEHEWLKPGTHYQIPYRCFLPQGLDGILVAGRCLSADHHALGSARVMVVCLPMGEACGIAAALAADRSCPPRQIQADDIRTALRNNGTVVV